MYSLYIHKRVRIHTSEMDFRSRTHSHLHAWAQGHQVRKQLRFSLLHRVSCRELSVYVCPKSFLCTRWQVTRRWEVLISTSRIHHLVTDKSERPDHLKSNSRQRSLDQSRNKVVDVTGQVCRRPASSQLCLSFLSPSVCSGKSPLWRLLRPIQVEPCLRLHVRLSQRSVVSVEDLFPTNTWWRVGWRGRTAGLLLYGNQPATSLTQSN